MGDEEKPREVLEPEVLPPEGRERRAGRTPWKRPGRAFSPILAGVFIDLLNVATQGTWGLLIGAVAGYWIGAMYALPFRTRLLLALAAAYYCWVPFARFLPLATLVGAYVRFRGGR